MNPSGEADRSSRTRATHIVGNTPKYETLKKQLVLHILPAIVDFAVQVLYETLKNKLFCMFFKSLLQPGIILVLGFLICFCFIVVKEKTFTKLL